MPSRPRLTVLAVLVAVLTTGALSACGSGDDAPDTAAERVAAGKETFDAVCAACHGRNLGGTAAGPSMLDPVFAPATHPDAAFYDAVAKGVTPHGHFADTTWGPMPAIPAVSRDEVTNVLAYVRERQRAAGVGS